MLAAKLYPSMPMPTLVRVAPDPVDVVEYLYLAEVVARKFYRGNDRIRDTDVFSVACQELVKCGKIYNPEIGPFDRFAMRAMRNGVVQYLRLKQSKKRISNFEEISDREWQDVPEFCVEELDFSLLKKILTKLPDVDRFLIEEVYLQNKPIAEVAERLHVSRVTVYTRSQKILATLREKIVDELNDEGQRV